MESFWDRPAVETKGVSDTRVTVKFPNEVFPFPVPNGKTAREYANGILATYAGAVTIVSVSIIASWED